MTINSADGKGRVVTPAPASMPITPPADHTGWVRARHRRFTSDFRIPPAARRILLNTVPAHGRHRDNNREYTVYASHVPKLMDALRAAGIPVDEWPVGR